MAVRKDLRFLETAPWTRKALWCRVYDIPLNDRVESGLVSENEWLIYSRVGKMIARHPWLQNDILSNCRNALVEAIRTWKPVNGQIVNWKNWAQWKILFACQIVVDHEHKHDNGNRSHNTDFNASSDTANVPSSSSSINFLGESAGEAITALPEPDKTIVWMTVVEGESIKQTARYCKLSQKETLARKEAALQAMKSIILENSECLWAMDDLSMNQ